MSESIGSGSGGIARSGGGAAEPAQFFAARIKTWRALWGAGVCAIAGCIFVGVFTFADLGDPIAGLAGPDAAFRDG